jgi:hypothetical protein
MQVDLKLATGAAADGLGPISRRPHPQIDDELIAEPTIMARHVHSSRFLMIGSRRFEICRVQRHDHGWRKRGG